MDSEASDDQAATAPPAPDWDVTPPSLPASPIQRVTVTAALAVTAALWALLAIYAAGPSLQDRPEFNLWAVMVSVQVALWVVFASLLMRHLGLMTRAVRIRLVDERDRRMLTRRAAGVVAAVWAIGGVFFIATSSRFLDLTLEPPDDVSFALRALTLVGALAALPSFPTVSHIREFASMDSAWPPGGYATADLAYIGFLRRELRTVVGVLGVVIAMIVLTTAGLLNALEAERIAPDHGVDLVLATGAIYSGFLIGLYLYGRAAVNRRASDMLDTWAPLPPTGDTATLETGLEWRAKLTKHLGLEASLRDSVATTTLVALPLLSALMTSLVGQGVNF